MTISSSAKWVVTTLTTMWLLYYADILQSSRPQRSLAKAVKHSSLFASLLVALSTSRGVPDQVTLAEETLRVAQNILLYYLSELATTLFPESSIAASLPILSMVRWLLVSLGLVVSLLSTCCGEVLIFVACLHTRMAMDSRAQAPPPYTQNEQHVRPRRRRAENLVLH